MRLLKKKFGFTIIEILIVVVIVTIIAAFTIPNYNKSVYLAHEREAKSKIILLYDALRLYYAENGEFIQTGSTAVDINTILDDLNVQISTGELVMDYAAPDDNGDEATFCLRARFMKDDGTEAFDIFMDQREIEDDGGADDNPCCSDQATPEGCRTVEHQCAYTHCETALGI